MRNINIKARIFATSRTEKSNWFQNCSQKVEIHAQSITRNNTKVMSIVGNLVGIHHGTRDFD
jgi:hypothetical protein